MLGHKLNSEAVVGVSLERVVQCVECMEGSGKGEQAWAGATLKHCPKIISFCNPVHFFLGTIQYFFFSVGFLAYNNASHRICLQSRALELICIPHPPLARAGKGQGAQLGQHSSPGAIPQSLRILPVEELMFFWGGKG